MRSSSSQLFVLEETARQKVGLEDVVRNKREGGASGIVRMETKQSSSAALA